MENTENLAEERLVNLFKKDTNKKILVILAIIILMGLAWQLRTVNL